VHCGVSPAARTIVFPASGAATLSQTPLADLGVIVADAIVTGRGRDATIYTGVPITFEAYAQMIEAASGDQWTRITRTREESEAALAGADADARFIAMWELTHALVDGEPNPAAAWPIERTYSHLHGIPTTPIEDILRRVFTKAPSA
jgi:hypothetical protein